MLVREKEPLSPQIKRSSTPLRCRFENNLIASILISKRHKSSKKRANFLQILSLFPKKPQISLIEKMAIHSKIYLDKRHKRVDGTYALKVGISKNGSTAYISLGVFVFPSQWDKIAQKVLDVKNKDAINLFISNEKIKIDNTIMELSNSGALVRVPIVVKLNPLSYTLPEF